MKLFQKETLVQFLKFGMVGFLNTVISLAVYYIFISIDVNFYLTGNIVGWLVSVANAFFWNSKYVFLNEDRDWSTILKKIGKTYLSYGGTFLVNTVLLYIEVDYLHWAASLCPILNLLITIPSNFVLSKFWTFR